MMFHIFSGAVLLDHEGKDLTNVMSSIVDELVNIGYINEDTGTELLRVLLFRHKYVDSKITKWSTSVTRNHSLISMTVSTIYRVVFQTWLFGNFPHKMAILQRVCGRN